MSVKITIAYPHLQQFTNNRESIEVNGSSVGECLGDLIRQFPGIDKGILDEHGQLLSYVYFIINGKGVCPTALTQKVREGDELVIALLLAGG
jgi:molybdopterin converting factor small subunit